VAEIEIFLRARTGCAEKTCAENCAEKPAADWLRRKNLRRKTCAEPARRTGCAEQTPTGRKKFLGTRKFFNFWGGGARV